ncbi:MULTISPECIES: 50S ribosomal protein L25/general stress protein Ctc [unclassified Isoptericola]|uniref:50S ribosomal protein L25/general stress protein Ctc n=1 Tax=unclassified Isoptericola TaxID=2623355 RepID=UPI002712C566|nr:MULTISPECIES: 50S ribosomal protein L25/general stress protein Ctc [unclassified Isoptericola]MDO8144026.1 50S ribosomal protein L25/general stress protein Ctc [Isoptericola sp. 178]MDO8149442.1 50S ribosomal protein L25/general stress protein Ctc [Isoptericola sp. b515]MDO8152389.1 50S ribosomal protein L25/general stress protein Ctc [Isoptericola sp. b408]
MAEIKLASEVRTEFGKGAARRIRRANNIPAVLYGHGTDPVHVTLPGHATMLAVRHTNALIELTFDNGTELAVVKDIQRHPVTWNIEHIDLLLVKKGEKIAVDVWIQVDGESAPGTIHFVESQTVSVETDATSIPEYIHVSIEGRESGDNIHAGDLEMPKGVTLLTDPEHAVVTITEPRGEESAEEAEEESAASAEPTEGESSAE